MNTRMKRFDAVGEILACLSLVIGGAVAIGWSSLL